MDTELLTNPVYPSGWTPVATSDEKVFVQLDAVVEGEGEGTNSRARVFGVVLRARFLGVILKQGSG